MIDRRILRFGFGINSFPQFACPRCNRGTLIPNSKLETYHPPFSSLLQQELWAGIEHVKIRLSKELRCNSEHCGESVSVHCNGTVEYGYDAYGETIHEEYLKISSIHPSPHIINLPELMPDEIKEAMLTSFSAFWLDKALCANAVRRALEALLGQLRLS